jgi:hypothetical protein
VCHSKDWNKVRFCSIILDELDVREERLKESKVDETSLEAYLSTPDGHSLVLFYSIPPAKAVRHMRRMLQWCRRNVGVEGQATVT